MAKLKKEAPCWAVIGQDGKVMATDFHKMRLARRAAERLQNDGGHPANLRNMRTGETVKYIPYPKEQRVQINLVPQAAVAVDDHLSISVHKREPDLKAAVSE